MTSFDILDYIEKNKELVLTNNSRYCIDFKEKDHITKLIFGVPIKYKSNNKIVSPVLVEFNQSFVFCGSDSTITIKNNNYQFRKQDTIIDLFIDDVFEQCHDNTVQNRLSIVHPTLNGMKYTVNANKFVFRMKVNIAFDLRVNDRTITIIKDEFVPILTVSCLGAYGVKNEFLGIAQIIYKKVPDGFECTVFSPFAETKKIEFEVNAFEEKMFLDTTVESKNVYMNNVYGSLAVIGRSNQFGEQILYTKLLSNEFLDLSPNRIKSIKLYYSKYVDSSGQLILCQLASNFCSLGATWNNKIETNLGTLYAHHIGPYFCIDITDVIVENSFSFISGFPYILKANTESNSLIPINTGDSYVASPFVCVDYYDNI